MSIPRYEAYSDSGLDWLGKVPKHWTVRALKHIVSTPITDGPHETPEFVEEGMPFVSAEAIGAGVIDFSRIRGFISHEEHARYSQKYRPQRDDIFMVKSGATTGVTAIVDADAEFNIWSPLAAIRCGKDVLPRFVLSFLRSKNFQEAITLGWSFGTQQNIGMGVIENLAIALPPFSEQLVIAAFLDHEVAKIEALVREQERLIVLLGEKRRALITQAVTKGFAPGARMTKSGIEWLGEVPAHWQIVRLGALFREIADPGRESLPVLSVSIHHGVSDREFDDDEIDRKVTRSEDRTKYKSVRPGDLVYNMMRAWQGGFGTVKVLGMVSPAYVVARPMSELETGFVEQVLRTPQAVEELRRHSRGVTDFRLRLYWDEFKAIKIALPPIREQREVLKCINHESARLDALRAEAYVGISLLQERRSALISAAVTGQIDVRGLVAGQPDKEAA